jgi:hypothetical protein
VLPYLRRRLECAGRSMAVQASAKNVKKKTKVVLPVFHRLEKTSAGF